MVESADKLNWVKYAFWTAVIAFYIYAGAKWLFVDLKYYFPYAIVHVVAVLWFISIGTGIIWRSRYRGHHVTVNGVSGSIYGPPEYVPDPSMGKGFHWAVFNLGFSMLPPLRGKLGTLVVPADQLYVAGKNYVGLTLAVRWPLGLVPNRVNFFLRQNEGDYNLNKIYFGKYSQQFIDNSGQEKDLNEQIKAKDSLINVLQKANENKFDGFEEIKEFADRMTGNKFSLKKFVGKVTKEDEE